jgi:purine-nucleoside phosphorylase
MRDAIAMDRKVEEAAAFVRARGFDGHFDAAFVLGTGLAALADAVEDCTALPYADIPHAPRSGVSGHPGRLVAGRLEGRRILVFQGRTHYYEAGDAASMRVPIGLVQALGGPPLILTNAAGSTRPQIRPGSLVAITDHINLSGANPLVGEHSEARFVSLTGAYDEDLRTALGRAARAVGTDLQEGVYVWFSGPSFETPAEIRMAQVLGADLVGMSTVPEVLLARFYGLRVAALSVVTNMAAGIEGASPSHQDTKDVAGEAGPRIEHVLRVFLRDLTP